jgi:predicted enzyme related to lactoylglutathione lyase
MKIKMTSVYVEDPVKAIKYYTEVLGFKEYMFIPEANLAIVVSAEQPDGTALLLEPNSNPIAKNYQTDLYQSSFPVITFGSDDIEADYQNLKSKGVRFLSEPIKSEWGTSVIFDDSCGNLIQLHQG